MPKKLRKLSVLLIILLLPSVVYVFLATGIHRHVDLPYYGERYAETVTVDEKTVIDTVYHSTSDFKFINHLGNEVSEKDIEGKIVVIDYFFATCQGICPKMANNLMVVQERFRDREDVVILSHTVNPENDTLNVLKAYAKDYGAIDGKWHFLTGEKQELYEMAVKSYLIPVSEDVLAPGGFLHSEMLILVDKKRHIRGFFDGTNSNEVNDLINAVKLLLAQKETIE